MSDAIGRLRQALVKWYGLPAMVLLFALAAMVPGTAAAQATSTYCPSPFTATINSGGSVTFEVGNCDGPSDVGMGTGNNTIEPSHGTRVVNQQTPAGQTVPTPITATPQHRTPSS